MQCPACSRQSDGVFCPYCGQRLATRTFQLSGVLAKLTRWLVVTLATFFLIALSYLGMDMVFHEGALAEEKVFAPHQVTVTVTKTPAFETLPPACFRGGWQGALGADANFCTITVDGSPRIVLIRGNLADKQNAEHELVWRLDPEDSQQIIFNHPDTQAFPGEFVAKIIKVSDDAHRMMISYQGRTYAQLFELDMSDPQVQASLRAQTDSPATSVDTETEVTRGPQIGGVAGFSELNANPASVNRAPYLGAWECTEANTRTSLIIRDNGTARVEGINLNNGQVYNSEILKWEPGANPYEFILYYYSYHHDPITCRLTGTPARPALAMGSWMRFERSAPSASQDMTKAPADELAVTTKHYFGAWTRRIMASTVTMTIHEDGWVTWQEVVDDGRTTEDRYQWTNDPETVHGIQFDMSGHTIRCSIHANVNELQTSMFGSFARKH